MIDYLKTRGFNNPQALVEKFKMTKIWNPIGVYYIKIPIFNEFREEEAYVLDNYKRAKIEGNPIDRYSFRFLKKDKSILFNANRVFRRAYECGGSFPSGCIFVTEGIYDCISLDCLGVDSVAITRAFMSFSQVRKISRYTNKVILCLDNDETGKKASEKAKVMFERCGCVVIEMHIRGAKDINDLYRDDMLQLVNSVNEVMNL